MNISNLGTLRANITADTKDLTKGLNKGEKELKTFGKDVPKWLAPASKAMVGIGVATVAAVGLSVKHFATFEQSMKNVQAVSGATAEEYDRLKDFAIEMGSQTVFTATEAGDAMYYLASAGLNVADQMATTAAVLDLAAATQTDLAESSRIVVNTLSGFTLEAEQSRRVADVFAESISSSQANMGKLGVAMPVVSATMDDLGISLETTVTGLSMLFDKGGRAETAATGLRNAMKKLIDPTDEAVTEIERLGLTVEELDPRTVSLVDIIKKLEQAGFDTAASIKLFGLENDAMNKLVATGSEKFAEFEASLKGAAGAAEDMKDLQLDSLSGDIKLLSSAVDGAVIAFGETFSSTIRESASLLTELVTKWNNLGDTTQSIIAWTAALGGVSIGLIGGITLLGLAIPGVVAGFTALAPIVAVAAPLLLGLAELALVLWAVHEVIVAIKTPSDDLATSLAALETTQTNVEGTTKTLKDELAALEKDGVAPANVTVGDLDVSAAALMETLNDKGGIWDKLAGWITGAGDPIEVMITNTTAVEPLLAALEKTAGRTATEMEKLVTQIGYVNGELTPLDGLLKDVDTDSAFLTDANGAFSTATAGSIRDNAGAFDDHVVAVGKIAPALEVARIAEVAYKDDQIADAIAIVAAADSSAEGVIGAHVYRGDAISIVEAGFAGAEAERAEIHKAGLLDIQAADVAHTEALTSEQIVQRDLEALRASDEAAELQARILGYEEFTTIQTVSMADYLKEQEDHYTGSLTGFANFMDDTDNLYDDVRGLWSDLTGDQKTHHNTWLEQAANWTGEHVGQLLGWYKDTKDTISDVLDLWNKTAGLINVAWSKISGEEGSILSDALKLGDVLGIEAFGPDEAAQAAIKGGGVLGAATTVAAIAAPVAAAAYVGVAGAALVGSLTRDTPAGAELGADFDTAFAAALTQEMMTLSPGMTGLGAVLTPTRAEEIYQEVLADWVAANQAAQAGGLGDPSLDPNLSIQQRQQLLNQPVDPNVLLQQIADNTSGANAIPNPATTFELIQALAALVSETLADDGYINANPVTET